jgi:endonuclease YncB( thermonuclease family)
MARNVTRFYRGARRHPKWDMGTPPGRRPPRRGGGARLVKWLIFGAVFLLAGLPAVDAVNGAIKTEGTCKVVRVIDGDTVDLWCGGAELDRARLTGFDTAEIFSPQCLAERVTGLRGLWALKVELLSASTIRVSGNRRDRYDRRLVALRVDGTPLATRMIDRGVARAYSGGRRAPWCS